MSIHKSDQPRAYSGHAHLSILNASDDEADAVSVGSLSDFGVSDEWH
jgi:hypothetical protein